MASLWQAIKNVFRRNAHQAAEALADPAADADLKIADAKKMCDRYQSQVASAIAQNKKMKRQLSEAKDEAKKWDGIANEAAESGNREDAKRALEKKNEAKQRVDILTQEIKKNDKVSEKLRKELDKLRREIGSAEADKEILKARREAAKIRQESAKARSEFGGSGVIAGLKELKNDTYNQESLAEAEEELSGSSDESLEEKYSSATSGVDDELEALMKKNTKKKE